MIVYFNGFRMQAKDNSRIAQTKQINNLFDLSTRQTNITNAIDFPRTGVNVVAMEFLGVTGNNSNVPYQLNSVSMYSDSGECFIHNGKCRVISTTDVYTVQFLDGNIDIYKAIGNDKLGSLDLPDVKHLRTTEAVKRSWDENITMNYKYIVADYNGKALTDEGFLNMDYLVPSIRVSYLWQKMFDNYGFTYTGSFFNTPDFKNLWLTYPKGVQINESETVRIFESDNWYWKPAGSLFVQPYSFSNFLSFNEASLNDLENTDGNIRFQVGKTGSYRIKITGTLQVYWRANGKDFAISVAKNLLGNIDRNSSAQNYSDWVVISSQLSDGVKFEKEVVVDAEAGDILFLIMRVYSNVYNVYTGADGFKVEIEYINSDIIDFGKALQDFGTKDFLNEIVNRHALVPVKEKYSNNYHFDTLDELLERKDAVDWSYKNPEFKRENYLYNGYSQRNYFKLKYEDKESEFNDGFIQINNQSLEDKGTAYQSQLYSPESVASILLDKVTNIYKLWAKDINEDSTISYKPVDKRFFFISYENRIYSGTLKSEFNGDTATFGNYPAESFKGLDFSSAIAKFYRNSSVMMNRAKVLTLSMLLSDIEVSNIDLTRQVYFKQYASNFLINKINNYISPSIPVDLELIALGEVVKQDEPINSDVIKSLTWKREKPTGSTNFAPRLLIEYDRNFFTTTQVRLVIADYTMVQTWDNTGFLNPLLPSFYLGLTIQIQIVNDFAKSEIKTITLK